MWFVNVVVAFWARDVLCPWRFGVPDLVAERRCGLFCGFSSQRFCGYLCGAVCHMFGDKFFFVAKACQMCKVAWKGYFLR